MELIRSDSGRVRINTPAQDVWSVSRGRGRQPRPALASGVRRPQNTAREPSLRRNSRRATQPPPAISAGMAPPDRGNPVPPPPPRTQGGNSDPTCPCDWLSSPWGRSHDRRLTPSPRHTRDRALRPYSGSQPAAAFRGLLAPPGGRLPHRSFEQRLCPAGGEMETAAAGSEESGAAEEPGETAAGREDGGCEGLWELPVERCVRRAECGRCRRPQKVCLCPFFPVHPLKVSTCLYIIQHPAEESRVLRTVPLLTACLPGDKCKVLIGRRFGEDRYPELAAVCRNSNTLILYPGAEAANLEEVALIFPSPSTIIIIDGTWSQAKDIFYKNSLFRLPKQATAGRFLAYFVKGQQTLVLD
ncbi:tRNA-uridine aminocarboxypropyltransferase 2 isoform X4 [Dermochelys coriacea]|uniref:tRNA-uridine aminocarboxypropyltransferase 2 isoform X4 n=1 Tax=Dermochelys coriacea TaxID=27794 RepID=UPI001CA8A9A7|nr:tRNA-uridine aminocarboxypropyltransferase 2 isoform X4 [Dermochelys coriacea]